TKPVAAGEVKLAVQLIEQIATKKFEPEKYEDEVKGRMLQLIEGKIQGQEITAAPEPAPQAQVIDLMDALRKSLGMGGGGAAAEGGKAEHKSPKRAAKKPAEAAGDGKRKRAKA